MAVAQVIAKVGKNDAERALFLDEAKERARAEATTWQTFVHPNLVMAVVSCNCSE